ncbi:hypothetical protein ACFLU8_03520, partial [Chloroflexota bacterium]
MVNRISSLLKESGNRLVCKPRPIIGMKPSDNERKLWQHDLQYRHQISFRYPFHRGYDFLLRDLIHGIDMIHPILSVEIPLMNCVYSNVTRLPLRVWFG